MLCLKIKKEYIKDKIYQYKNFKNDNIILFI